MSFYKLFYVVHKRTDFVDMFRIARELAYPEWYDEHETSNFENRRRMLSFLSACQVLNNVVRY